MTKNFITRPYNTIRAEEGKIFKTCPIDRAINETLWFEVARKFVPDHLPQIFGGPTQINKHSSEYVMEEIQGSNLYQYCLNNSLSTPKKEAVLDSVLDLVLDKMKVESRTKIPVGDIDEMYLNKPFRAAADYIRSNGFSCEVLAGITDSFERIKYKLYDHPSSFIHGDMTFGNIIIRNDQTLFLIDPRGKFGRTSFFGDKRYDLAKIYYSVVGNFESLNNGDFSTIGDYRKSNFRYSIKDLGFSSLESYFFNSSQLKSPAVRPRDGVTPGSFFLAKIEEWNWCATPTVFIIVITT